MKKWFSKANNLITILIVVFAVYKLYPSVKNNFMQENKSITPVEVSVYGENRMVYFPPQNGRAIAIFWATWCGPCKIEMERLKSSVKSGAIPKDRIFAINPFESSTPILKFIKENDYPFQFIESSVGNQLGVSSTPTTLLIDESKIVSMSSGMSLFGIWRAEFFF